jgi:hypothetical protein
VLVESVAFVCNFKLIRLSAFSIRSFKSQASAVAGILFTLSVHCRTMFSLSDKKECTCNGTTLSCSAVKVLSCVYL